DTSNDISEEPLVVPEPSSLIEEDGEVSAAQ
ncbi:MAG: envelope biogenesis factor ElyC, partial [Vibrio sp.]